MKYLELFETQLKQIQSNFRKQDKHLVFSTRSHLIMATGVSDDCIRFRIVGQHVHEWHKENLIYTISKLNFGLRGASYIWYESEGKLFPACDYYSYFKTGDDITQKTMQIYSDIPRLEHELDSNLLALLSGDNLWATLQDPEQETGPLSLRLLHSNVDGKSEEYQEKFLNQLISECYRKKEHILSVDENTVILKRASSTESEVICAIKVIKGHDILSLYVSLDGDAKHTTREMLAAITNEMNRMLDGPKFEVDLHSKTHGFVNILGINALTNPNSILPWMEESLITMQETFERLAEKHTPAGNSQKPAA